MSNTYIVCCIHKMRINKNIIIQILEWENMMNDKIFAKVNIMFMQQYSLRLFDWTVNIEWCKIQRQTILIKKIHAHKIKSIQQVFTSKYTMSKYNLSAYCWNELLAAKEKSLKYELAFKFGGPSAWKKNNALLRSFIIYSF